jgi:hypothetical protein
MRCTVRSSVVVALALLCGCSSIGTKKDCQGREQERYKPSIVVNDSVLYDLAPVQLAEYDYNDLFYVVRELRYRAVNGDARALNRLIKLYLSCGDSLREGFGEELNSVYLCIPKRFLKATYRCAGRDKVYRWIIYDSYYDDVFGNREMPGRAQIEKYGRYSDRLLKMYDYYRRHPREVENSEIPVIENGNLRDRKGSRMGPDGGASRR